MRGIRSRATFHASATSSKHGKTPISCSASVRVKKFMRSFNNDSRSFASRNALTRRRWLSRKSLYDTVTSVCITQACTVRRKKSRFGRLWPTFAVYFVLWRVSFFVGHSANLAPNHKAVFIFVGFKNVIFKECCIFATPSIVKPSFERRNYVVIWRMALTF